MTISKKNDIPKHGIHVKMEILIHANIYSYRGIVLTSYGGGFAMITSETPIANVAVYNMLYIFSNQIMPIPVRRWNTVPYNFGILWGETNGQNLVTTRNSHGKTARTSCWYSITRKKTSGVHMLGNIFMTRIYCQWTEMFAAVHASTKCIHFKNNFLSSAISLYLQTA